MLVCVGVNHLSIGGLSILECSGRSRFPDRSKLDQIDIDAVSDYKVKDWTGAEWVKLTYDSGAATSALPLSMDPGNQVLEKKGTFVVANDGTVDHYQRFKYPAWDEQGYQRDFSGWLTSVNKPLVAAGEVSKTMDSYLHDRGGVLMDKSGEICKGMRRASQRLQKKY